MGILRQLAFYRINLCKPMATPMTTRTTAMSTRRVLKSLLWKEVKDQSYSSVDLTRCAQGSAPACGGDGGVEL